MGRSKHITKKLAVKRRWTGRVALVKSRKIKYPDTDKQLRKIKRQEDPEFAISRAAFKRLVREIIADSTPTSMLVQPNAFNALQRDTEAYFADVFKDTQLVAVKRKSTTISVDDMRTAMRIPEPMPKTLLQTLLQFDEANRKTMVE